MVTALRFGLLLTLCSCAGAGLFGASSKGSPDSQTERSPKKAAAKPIRIRMYEMARDMKSPQKKADKTEAGALPLVRKGPRLGASASKG